MRSVSGFVVVLCLAFFSATALAGADDSPARVAERMGKELDARVGFAAFDLESGQRWEYQANQRFPVSSTFKTLACAALLQRADAGEEQLDRKVSFSETDLVPHSPVTTEFAGRQAMTLSELCEATLATSDNTAANLVLKALGGPGEVTSFAASLGDDATRLDRWEAKLNEGVPGDDRDTTTPASMVSNLRKLLFGDVLSNESRDRLRGWLENNEVADDLFRAVVPDGWIVADRTGAGGYGSRSITAILWPPDREPIVVALYITETEASFSERNGAIAELGSAIVAQVGG